MGLSGLEIYKRLPKTNCKKCGVPTCLAFAMQLAAKKVSLDQCPYVSEEAKKFLSEASQPPIRLITIGKEKGISVGNETVLFRHEETFYHPTLIGVEIDDNLSDKDLEERISSINKLKFERVGKTLSVDLIAVRNISSKENFLKTVKAVSEKTPLNLFLISESLDNFKLLEPILKEKAPLLYCPKKDNLEGLVKLAREMSCPLVIGAENLDELASFSEKIRAMGFENIVLKIDSKTLSENIWNFTQIRRLALKKALRLFGYPILSIASNDDPSLELFCAATSILKYAGIVIVKNIIPDEILPLLTLREDLYTDPQKPVQVEPKLYELGHVTEKSPVLITTNFSITYFTVAGEVEASRIPSFLLSVDSEGMSVLTAWAAEKFTPERIAKTLKDLDVMGRVNHKRIIIPGYVSVMSGKLEDESGLEVIVGPREASGIPNFLKNLK